MKKPLKVVSPEEAEHLAKLANAKRTPNERVEALQALRNAFLTPDQCRIERTCRYIKFP